MGRQIHKRFTNEQVQEMLTRYVSGQVEGKHIRSVLGLGKTRFFHLVKQHRQAPETFSIQYHREGTTRQLDPAIEKNILRELAIDKRAILNPAIPLKHYNYSYVRQRLQSKYRQKAALSTIINRAKKHDFWKKDRRRRIHDREVLTRYVGELIQHDSSIHLWAPAAKVKWYLITSLDDFSRFILYAFLVSRETVWTHLQALQSVVMRWGYPYAYYVDCHSIFRFVRGRDEIHHQDEHSVDRYDPTWKQVLQECGIKPIYALSPQAKGKVERPYQWLQDHLIRTCIRENVRTIQDARKVLEEELHQYNYKRVHSTTGQIPYLRFRKAIKAKQSLFRPFALPPPLRSVKDLFCFRHQRFVDPYRKVSINRLALKVNHVRPRDLLTLRIYLLSQELSEIRFWRENQLVDVQRVKNDDLKLVQF
jgi:hypothetical protein